MIVRLSGTCERKSSQALSEIPTIPIIPKNPGSDTARLVAYVRFLDTPELLPRVGVGSPVAVFGNVFLSSFIGASEVEFDRCCDLLGYGHGYTAGGIELGVLSI